MYVAEDAELGTPEVLRGLFPMMIAALIYEQLPHKQANHLVLCGAKTSGRAAIEKLARDLEPQFWDVSRGEHSRRGSPENDRDQEILYEILFRRLPPGYERAYTHEENQDERYRDVHAVEIRRADEDLVPRERLRYYREYGAEEYGERGPQEEQVVEYERALS